MKILAIDPGNIESAYCLMDSETYKPMLFGKTQNEEIKEFLVSNKYCDLNTIDAIVIEMIASYGMPVGKEVFDTCVWIGKFGEASGMQVNYIYRKEEKMNLCHSMKAKDSNIRQALIDRFGVVGTKKNPGWFYGFKADIWAAYAVGVTYLDKMKGENTWQM
jgi:hypothetical protein